MNNLPKDKTKEECCEKCQAENIYGQPVVHCDSDCPCHQEKGELNTNSTTDTAICGANCGHVKCPAPQECENCGQPGNHKWGCCPMHKTIFISQNDGCSWCRKNMHPSTTPTPKNESWKEDLKSELWYLFQECRAREKHTFDCKCMSGEGKRIVDFISRVVFQVQKECSEHCDYSNKRIKEIKSQARHSTIKQVIEKIEGMKMKWARTIIWKEHYKSGYNQALEDLKTLLLNEEGE